MPELRPNISLVVDNAIDEVMSSDGRLALKGGGGGGTSGGMDARVTALETDMRSIREALIRIESKLDTKASSAEVAELKGKLDGKASTTDLGAVLGKIEGRPTTLQVLTMVVLLGGIMAGSQIIKTVYDLWHPNVTIQSSK